MNLCFGIITLNPTPGLADKNFTCFQKLQRKFPSALGSKNLIRNHAIEIIGDIEQSIHHDSSSLFFCGELYNSEILKSGSGHTLPVAMNTAERIHVQIEKFGIAGLSDLNGRFTIVYQDLLNKTLHIINDQMGIQQLYYFQHKDFILFGSEIKFLLAHPICPCEIDWEHSLKRSLPFQVINGAINYNAWFKQINLLSEGSDLQILLGKGSQIVFTKYWDHLHLTQASGIEDRRSIEQVMVEYMDLLNDSVRIRIQDSPIAYSLLSGGLDSSILCAMSANYKTLETFSIINRTTCLEDTTKYCTQLAKDLNFDNSQFMIPVHKLSANRNLWKQRIWRAESPYNHPDSLAKTLLHSAIRTKNPNIKYTLTGTGSDQWNGGLVRWVVNDAEDHDQSWNNFYKQILDEENKCFIDRKYETLWASREFIHRDFLEHISNRKLECNSWMFYVNSNLHLDMFSLLWDENRAASSHEHSIRYPFLDHRFASFISKIPIKFHPQLFYDKQILRQPSRKLLPEYVIDKPKAPAVSGLYDYRNDMYNALLPDNDLSLIEEALGSLNEPHPVIDKKRLVQSIHRMKEEPDQIEWQYLIHIINLGLLEKLADQDETSMSYEQTIDQPIEIFFDNTDQTRFFLEQALDIIPELELMEKAIQFEENCGLVRDTVKNTYFLFKNNILNYEIDDSNPEWKSFLLSIDQSKTTREILESKQIDFALIKEYYDTLIKEQILIYKLNG